MLVSNPAVRPTLTPPACAGEACLPRLDIAVGKGGLDAHCGSDVGAPSQSRRRCAFGSGPRTSQSATRPVTKA